MSFPSDEPDDDQTPDFYKRSPDGFGKGPATISTPDGVVSAKRTIVPLQDLEYVTKPGRGRHYPIPGTDILAPSVTNVLDILSKPPLIFASARLEREHVMRCAARLHEDRSGFVDLTADFERALVEQVTSGLGKQMKYQVEWKGKASIGTDIHTLIQGYCKADLGEGPLPDKPAQHSEAAALGLMAWQDWAKSVNLKPILVEQTVWSERMRSAGTFDLYGEMDYADLYGINRRKCVFDWKANKTSKVRANGIYDESLIQVSVYTQMLIELGHAPEDCLVCIVRLPKTLDDPIFDKERSGALDTKIVLPEQRKKLAEGFVSIQKTWHLMRETMR